MIEKVILILGCVIGGLAGLLFYVTADKLSLPAPIFFIVDMFGVLAGSISVGLLSIPIAVGILILTADKYFPDSKNLQDH